MTVHWLPDGFHTITPNIIVDDAEQAVAFFKVVRPRRAGRGDGDHADDGYVLTIATRREDVAPAEMQRRMKAEGY